jgi:hypothetical protein
MPEHGAPSVTGVVPTDAHFHRWGLGIKQSSLGQVESSRVVYGRPGDGRGVGV